LIVLAIVALGLGFVVKWLSIVSSRS